MELTQAIIDDFKAGNLDAFYREAYPALLTYAARQLADGYAFLAEDCVQDCIFRSYQERDRITDPVSWRAYLYTSVHNACANLLRHHRVHADYVSQSSSASEMSNVALSFIEQEAFDLLYDAIDRLPDKYRRIFDLSFEQGLSNSEIAQMLSLSVSGVKKQKSKMLQMLREALPKESLMLLLLSSL